MKPRFVDTNIFVEALVRTGTKSGQSLALLENVKIQLWTTELVIAETEWVLRSGYEIPKPKVLDVLKRILNLENLEVENRSIIAVALGIYEEQNTDFTDCLNFAKIQENGVTEIYSFDRDYDKFKPLNRLES